MTQISAVYTAEMQTSRKPAFDLDFVQVVREMDYVAKVYRGNYVMQRVLYNICLLYTSDAADE